LAVLLPKGVLQLQTGQTWKLTRPVAISASATLRIDRPGELVIGPGAYLEATAGGTIDLRNLTIEAVDPSGRPAAAPSPDRGFLLALRGGRLWLENDHVSNLGHLAVLSYGISFWSSSPGSGVVGCTIEGNFIGVYTSHASGVRITQNRISHSLVYGIDPHSRSSRILIQGNDVSSSGIHGIILADRVTDSRVVDNLVQGDRVHGIVIFAESDRNLVQGNRVADGFDGIVVTDSSFNLISGNTVQKARRFGLRISGTSQGNVAEGNTVSGSMVGAYIYGGASANFVLGNDFVADEENVRVRADAPRNVVSPIPPRSEVAP